MLILACKKMNPSYNEGMWYYEVAPTKIVRAGADVFTYSSDVAYQVGQLVTIEVGQRSLPGVVIRQVEKPDYPTKPISSLIEATPLPSALVDTALWMSDYYLTPLAIVLQTVLPAGLTKKRRTRTPRPLHAVRKRTKIVFNAQQAAAIAAITSGKPGSFLLQGVTGSGKTEVYKELARRTIDSGRSVIVLTPEIGLTPQLVAEFTHDFPETLVTHSQQTEAERHAIWLEALHSTTPRVVIGPRSALFAPLRDVGLIVIDEAHEPSYKQEQAPRYSALRLATMLARAHQAKAVFGSATPLVAERFIAEQHHRPPLLLTERAQANVTPAEVTLIDNKDRSAFKRHRFLSDALLTSIEQALQEGTQSLIFHNRRGSASTTLCEHCGWTAQCPHCFLPLTLHTDRYQLQCHICGYQEKVPTHCPVCRHADIIHKGIGTKLIESELRRLFPKARIARFDADNSADATMHAQYQALYDGAIDIAIGTQVVAKGLDLPLLRTVGVIQADSGLALPDYISDERTFQLLSQVVGRVGRNQHRTSLFVQTYQPTHPVITAGVAQDYEGFYQRELDVRQRTLFPPYVYLLKLTCVYKTEAGAVRAARDLARTLRNASTLQGVQILGPTPAFHERSGTTYRWQLTLKSKSREQLIDALRLVPASHWQSELDPLSLL